MKDAFRVVETIREKRKSRMDNDWITINGTHVEVKEGSVVKGPAALRSAGKKYRDVVVGGKTYKQQVVDTTGRKNRVAAKKMKDIAKALQDKDDLFKLNKRIKRIIEEESVREWPGPHPSGAEANWREYVRPESAGEKAEYFKELLLNSLNEIDRKKTSLEGQSSNASDYSDEKNELDGAAQYYKGLLDKLS